MSRPVVEVLYAEGCPHCEPALELVRRVASELRVKPDVRLIEVSSPGAATRLRFPGSPTIRVNGRDVDPAADRLTGYALGCRLFTHGKRLTGELDAAWIRKALEGR